MKKQARHTIAWCANCGWIHGVTSLVKCVEKESTVSVLKPLCNACQERMEKKEVCTVCGVKAGNQLFYAPIEYRKFGDFACNVFVCLCLECKQKPHEVIMAQIKLPDEICDACVQKFLCFTEQHEARNSSYKDWKNGFYKKGMKESVTIRGG
jgi:hypothetical protein